MIRQRGYSSSRRCAAARCAAISDSLSPPSLSLASSSTAAGRAGMGPSKTSVRELCADQNIRAAVSAALDPWTSGYGTEVNKYLSVRPRTGCRRPTRRRSSSVSRKSRTRSSATVKRSAGSTTWSRRSPLRNALSSWCWMPTAPGSPISRTCCCWSDR